MTVWIDLFFQEGHVAEQLSKEVADRTVKSVQSTTSPSPVTSPYSPELGYNSVAVGTSTTRRCYTERRKKWTKSKVNGNLRTVVH